MRTSVRLLIRKVVFATSFPPFISVYRFFYELVIKLTLKVFIRYPKIKAVYLRRGSAKGEIIPLISDIDFAVITNGISEEDRIKLLSGYDKLVKFTTLPDKTLEIYDEQSFFNKYESNNYFQFRFMEGKQSWKLLFGKDYIAELPDLPIEKMYGGFFTEIKVWWTIFEWRFFNNRKYGNEPVTINNTCYKTVSEILKMNLALNENVLEFDRKKALQISRQSFTGKDIRFLEKLENISAKNFRSNRSNILNETKDYVLKFLDNFYKEFKSHPYSSSLKEITQKVILLKHEWFLTDEINNHVNKLVDYVKENWSYTYKGSYLVTGVYFNIDEFLFMVQINPLYIPSVQEFAEFNRFHQNINPELKSRIKLFLLMPDAAFQLDTDDFNKSWQSVLYPPSNPDIFELLNRTEFKLDGEDYCRDNSLLWTKPVEHFLSEEKNLFYELLDNPSVYKLNNLDFLRIFWKTLQLVIINRSVKNGEIRYPLTLHAIESALDAECMKLPGELRILHEAYRSELKGEPEDISLLFPHAVDYLKEIGRS